MRDFPLSTLDIREPVPALTYGRQLAAGIDRRSLRGPLRLTGASAQVAAICMWALAERHPIVLPPAGQASVGGQHLLADAMGLRPANIDQRPDPAPPCGDVDWDVAFYTSGSTGSPRGFGFTQPQLAILATWYTAIYEVTDASIIITALPVAYNFTFVAGLCLAATVGARVHLVADPAAVFAQASALATCHDRCVVLANPVTLQQPPTRLLPGNVLIDSGGAPLSTTAISLYRDRVADLREGYGLTETGSLTHFDAEASTSSLGTVGRPMPGVAARIDPSTSTVIIDSPAIGRPLDTPAEGPLPSSYSTGDIGRIDPAGRLRLLGRADDHPVGGRWPRDILDALGPLLGTRCAAVHHPTPDHIRIRLTGRAEHHLADRLRAAVGDAAGIPHDQVHVDSSEQPLLASLKLSRPTANHEVPR